MKEQIIDKLIRALQSEGEFIRQNQDMSMQEKLSEMDVLLDTMKFLQGYDENVKILNKELEHRKRIAKYKADKPARNSEKGKYNRGRAKRDLEKRVKEDLEK